MSPRRVSLILSHEYPGRYALTALAGAVESAADLTDVELFFPREIEVLADDLRKCLARGDSVVVAFSFYSPSFPAAVDRLKQLRALVPGEFLAIAGGVHATAETRDTLRGGFDLVCVGEGEQPLVELLRRLKRGDAPETTPGFARLVDGREVRNERHGQVALDDYPPFAVRNNQFGAIEITRGCIYACRFCQTPFISKARFRHRSVENVRHWVEQMRAHRRFDVRFISPTSLSYGSADESVNLAAVDALLAAVREALGPDGRIFFGTFPSEVRPEHVSAEALQLIAKHATNRNLIIGGQSGSAKVLEHSRRGHDVEAIVRAVRISVENGFEPNVDFILGLPTETRDDVEQTIALMEQLSALGAKVHGHTFMPLPGTPFRDAPAGSLDPDSRLKLDQLASRQKLYGHWQQQLHTAKALADRRDAATRE